MSERDQLLDELLHAYQGDPWHGPACRLVVREVMLAEAMRRPDGGAHGIWELVLHLSVWTDEVARRLEGNAPRVPVDGDWPAMPSPTEAGWLATVARLHEAHERLFRALKNFPEERLDLIVGSGRDAPLGSGVSFRVMLHGHAQHSAYHTGQIAMLKRMYREGGERGG